MLGRKSRPPMIGLLTGSLISGNRSGAVEVSASSPRSPKNFDYGGVGLGIVAALEKSGDAPAVFSRNLSRSSPIPVCSPRRGKPCLEEMESAESLEEYTIVTYHEPNRTYTKVYGSRGGGDRSPFRIQNSQKSSVFHISPARAGDAAGAPASDFLSSCHLCQKKLHGEDIYMYRGEKAFCSSECRYRQIVMDERTENCSSEASRAVDVSTSPYANGQIFTAGILAI